MDERKISQRQKNRLLLGLEAKLEIPMFFLAFVWLWLFIVEIREGLTPWQQALGTIIWALFIAEYLLKFTLASSKRQFLRRNWLTAIAIFLPAFRIFRLLKALRILRGARIISTMNFVRALTSTQRVVREVREAQGHAPKAEMDAGIMLAHSLLADKDQMRIFVERIAGDVKRTMEQATGMSWRFQFTEPSVLDSDDPRMPADFLSEASLRMAQGPYDILLVVTDIALMSRNKTVEAGLPSPVCRMAVLSTRKLVAAPRGAMARDLLSPPVLANGAALLLHLLGHICGLRHKSAGAGGIMTPFRFKEGQGPASFSPAETQALQRNALQLPERELHGGGVLASLVFHILMALRHPGDLLRPLLASRAVLLPLSLPGLATAAVAPTFLLVFTAEIWDVGISLSNRVTVFYALLSILGATYYLVQVQNLFLPRQEKRVLTEHLAVANAVIFASILLAMIGLFLIVMALMLAIELYIFPEGLMSTWPTLNHGQILLSDKIRLAAFISTIGVTTGALAGGLEGRAVIKRLALFEEAP